MKETSTPPLISKAYCLPALPSAYAQIKSIRSEARGELAYIGVVDKTGTITRDDVIVVPAFVLDEFCRQWLGRRS